MAKATVLILHPGEMGAAVAACALAAGNRVLWTSEGRGADTARRAAAAGLTDAGSLGAALSGADVVLSVCPPHAAVQVAREVAAQGFRGLYVEGNAVSPGTTREIARLVESAGATFVDGGIVGGPPPTAAPAAGAATRLYLSGKGAERASALFTGTGLGVVALDGPVGAASALKMSYAAWTKGSTALLAATCAVAEHEGVAEALFEEWRLSQPELARRLEGVRGSSRKAWRWIAEMEEIADAFADAGQPDGFHRAAAEVYRRGAH
jgi:3-hydroxyisobutyrate dehydrogenase-like beta-hydroxyacid dehydrogenase